MGLSYEHPLYDIDDDATVAEFCLQDIYRSRLKEMKKDISEMLEMLDEEEDEER